MSMKVVNQNNNIAFKSTPIHRVNVRDAKTGELIPAVFSKLTANYHDVREIEKSQCFWNNGIANIICSHFIDKPKSSDFWAIEVINTKDLNQRLVALAETNMPTESKYLDLENIAVKNSLSYNSKGGRWFKKIGEVLFGSIINQAKRNQADYFHVCSNINSIPFYDAILSNAGISPAKCHLTKKANVFFLDRKNIDKYLTYISNEYQINFTASRKASV